MLKCVFSFFFFLHFFGIKKKFKFKSKMKTYIYIYLKKQQKTKNKNRRHLAPTAPDTLPCFAADNDDPFVIRKCPDVYFCGNISHAMAGKQQQQQSSSSTQDEKKKGMEGEEEDEDDESNHSGFRTELFEGGNYHARARLITLPVFADTGEAILVDIADPDLACHAIKFSATL